MRLKELEPRWITEAHEEGSSRWSKDDGVGETAKGIILLCPVCFLANAGPIGTHSVIVPFKDRGVPEGYMPSMPRWAATGATFDTLTTTPSILIIGGCGWHGFITNGEVSIL